MANKSLNLLLYVIRNSKVCWIRFLDAAKVADLHSFNPDSDRSFRPYADTDPNFHFNADTDPVPYQNDANLRQGVNRPPRLDFEPSRLHFQAPCFNPPFIGSMLQFSGSAPPF
jgi:hypothetical protein